MRSLLEEWHNLAGKLLSCSETLREQHHLGNELAVGFCHCQGAEQFLQIVRQVRSTSIARVHSNEDCHVCRHSYLLPHKLNRYACNIMVIPV